MTSPLRLVANVAVDQIKPSTIHYLGFPPSLTYGNETRKPMPSSIALAIGETSDGIFLFRISSEGQIVGDTWHQSEEEAKHQAIFEFGGSLSEWISVPDGRDTVEFALEQRSI